VELVEEGHRVLFQGYGRISEALLKTLLVHHQRTTKTTNHLQDLWSTPRLHLLLRRGLLPRAPKVHRGVRRPEGSPRRTTLSRESLPARP
jgi:hypothetical protein